MYEMKIWHHATLKVWTSWRLGEGNYWVVVVCLVNLVSKFSATLSMTGYYVIISGKRKLQFHSFTQVFFFFFSKNYSRKKGNDINIEKLAFNLDLKKKKT